MGCALRFITEEVVSKIDGEITLVSWLPAVQVKNQSPPHSGLSARFGKGSGSCVKVELEVGQGCIRGGWQRNSRAHKGVSLLERARLTGPSGGSKELSARSKQCCFPGAIPPPAVTGIPVP